MSCFAGGKVGSIRRNPVPECCSELPQYTHKVMWQDFSRTVLWLVGCAPELVLGSLGPLSTEPGERYVPAVVWAVSGFCVYSSQLQCVQ